MAMNLSDSFIWFRATGTVPVYIYNPLTGTKRHINGSEGALLRAAGGGTYPVLNVDGAIVSGIPNA